MKKGLTLTLLTVAVAMWGIQAMAEAPTISDLPTPVVGGVYSTTEANRFVYPDAFNLSNYVSDDVTVDADIKWSYELTGDPLYRINNADPINSATDDPTDPADGKELNLTDTDTAKLDTNPMTVTIRNIHLSPIGADPSTQPDPGANGSLGVVDSQTQTVTLWASDGESYTSATTVLYTDNGGNDRLSLVPEIQVKSWTFEGDTNGWAYAGAYPGAISPTSSTSGDTALCLASDLTGNYYGLWSTPISEIPVVANSVYRVRVKVTSSHASAGQTPFWDMYLNNYDGVNGGNLYGASISFLDGYNGANAAISTEKNFELWWTPPPSDASNTAWNNGTTGGFGTDNGSDTSVALVFRMMDFGNPAPPAGDGRSDLGCNVQDGTICMTEASVVRFALDSMTVVHPATDPGMYNIDSTFDLTTASHTGTVLVDDLLNTGMSQVAVNAGVLTITPNAAGALEELFNIDPGTDYAYDLGDGTTIDDNYPVTWNDNKLLRITAELTAPDANAETNPPDAIMFGVDGPSNEVNMQSYITRLGKGACAKAGMPKQGGYTVYQAFYWTHNASDAPDAWYQTLRPRLSLVNNFGLTANTVNNTGAFQVKSFKVEEVSFQ